MWPLARLSLQVNGLGMQGATHHEAVSALRNAGSCIRMTVLRDGLPPGEAPDPGGPREEQDAGTGQQPSNQEGQTAKPPSAESVEGSLSKRIEAVVCNGSDTVGGFAGTPLFFTTARVLFSHCLFASQPEQTTERGQVMSKLKKDSLQDGKHTMGVSRHFTVRLEEM